MNFSLLDGQGHRKYLTAAERVAFIEAAHRLRNLKARSFCLTVALTGARISEALQLTFDRIDVEACALVIETLKRRRRGVFRVVPVPGDLITVIRETSGTADKLDTTPPRGRIWPVSRTTGWKWVKMAMREAEIAQSLAKPRALRHAFAVEAARQRIAL